MSAGGAGPVVAGGNENCLRSLGGVCVEIRVHLQGPRQLELQYAAYYLDGSAAALEPYESECLGAVNEKATASPGHILRDPPPAAVLTEEK